MRIGAHDYRRAALERLQDAYSLWSAGRSVAAVYFAGRAVESMLRALLRLQTRRLETGHDIRELFRQAASVGALGRGDEFALYGPISTVASVWQNDLRFADETRFLKHLKDLKKDRRIKGDAVQYWARAIFNSAERIVNRGELVWSRSSKS